MKQKEDGQFMYRELGVSETRFAAGGWWCYGMELALSGRAVAPARERELEAPEPVPRQVRPSPKASARR